MLSTIIISEMLTHFMFFFLPQEIVKQVGLVEVIIARDQSLRAKFLPSNESGADHLSHAAVQELEEFVTKLQEQPEVFVHKAGRGVVGGIIHKLYSAAQRVSPIISA